MKFNFSFPKFKPNGHVGNFNSPRNILELKRSKADIWSPTFDTEAKSPSRLNYAKVGGGGFTRSNIGQEQKVEIIRKYFEQ